MEQNTIKHRGGTILAAKARDEYIEKGSTTVRCPKCNQIPNVDIQDMNNSHAFIKCSCGYLSLYEKGI